MYIPRHTDGTADPKLRVSRVPLTRLFQSKTLMYIAMPQVSQILLRKQKRAFPLRLVDVKSAVLLT